MEMECNSTEETIELPSTSRGHSGAHMQQMDMQFEDACMQDESSGSGNGSCSGSRIQMAPPPFGSRTSFFKDIDLELPDLSTLSLAPLPLSDHSGDTEMPLNPDDTIDVLRGIPTHPFSMFFFEEEEFEDCIEQQATAEEPIDEAETERKDEPENGNEGENEAEPEAEAEAMVATPAVAELSKKTSVEVDVGVEAEVVVAVAVGVETEAGPVVPVEVDVQVKRDSEAESNAEFEADVEILAEYEIHPNVGTHSDVEIQPHVGNEEEEVVASCSRATDKQGVGRAKLEQEDDDEIDRIFQFRTRDRNCWCSCHAKPLGPDQQLCSNLLARLADGAAFKNANDSRSPESRSTKRSRHLSLTGEALENVSMTAERGGDSVVVMDTYKLLEMLPLPPGLQRCSHEALERVRERKRAKLRPGETLPSEKPGELFLKEWLKTTRQGRLVRALKRRNSGGDMGDSNSSIGLCDFHMFEDLDLFDDLDEPREPDSDLKLNLDLAEQPEIVAANQVEVESDQVDMASPH